MEGKHCRGLMRSNASKLAPRIEIGPAHMPRRPRQHRPKVLALWDGTFGNSFEARLERRLAVAF